MFRGFSQPRHGRKRLHPRWPNGAQWLGAQGGTGDRRTAATLDLRAGQVTTAPKIVGLGFGTLDGVVKNPDGTDTRNACVEVAPRMSTCTGDSAYFNLGMLGPYKWAVTYRGGPLYTFYPEPPRGDDGGEGFKDVGIWHAAAAKRAA